jgi:multidrug resistance efflux pump
VLVQLEDRHLLAEVGEARAELEGLERRIEVERATITMAQRETGQRGPEGRARIASAKARAEGARIEAENAQSKHQIQEALHARDRIVSDEELRASDAQRRAAAARLAEAQANAVVVEQEARQAGETVSIRARGLAVLEANLAAAQARLNRAIADLESAAIRAPQAGAIIRRIVQPGASVIAGQPVISMWLGEELWVEAWIEEEDLRHVKTGNRATVTFHSLPGQFTGRVARVNLSTDMEVPESDVPQPRSSRLSSAPVLGVRIRLDELPPDLVPGLSAVVAIETGS